MNNDVDAEVFSELHQILYIYDVFHSDNWAT